MAPGIASSSAAIAVAFSGFGLWQIGPQRFFPNRGDTPKATAHKRIEDAEGHVQAVEDKFTEVLVVEERSGPKQVLQLHDHQFDEVEPANQVDGVENETLGTVTFEQLVADFAEDLARRVHTLTQNLRIDEQLHVLTQSLGIETLLGAAVLQLCVVAICLATCCRRRAPLPAVEPNIRKANPGDAGPVPPPSLGELMTRNGDSLLVPTVPEMLIQDHVKTDTDEECISRCLSVLEFDHWMSKGSPGPVAHIKGFGKGMPITSDWRELALERLDMYNFIAWDGDPPEETGFTALVVDFLRQNQEKKAIAFRLAEKVKSFKENWGTVIEEFKERIVIVAINLEEDMTRFHLQDERHYVASYPAGAQKFFMLGRIAVKTTGGKFVLSIGGGGISGAEAEASLCDGIKWVIFAVSRSKQEEYPSILDWAGQNCDNQNVEFVRGIDENEVLGFCNGLPKRISSRGDTPKDFASKIATLPSPCRITGSSPQQHLQGDDLTPSPP